MDLGPSRTPTPEDEIERMDQQVQLAGIDEQLTMFDDDTHPKPPNPAEEAITTMNGREEVDLMLDTPPIGQKLRTNVPQPEIDL